MLRVNHRVAATTFGAMVLTLVILGGNRPVLLFGDSDGQRPPAQQGAHTTVLFMCPHGAAKSVLASAYFPRARRGLQGG